MAPSSIGRQRRLSISLPSRTIEFPPIRSAGTNVPAGTLALVRSLLVLRCSSEQNALHTLIHQRHLTPSCGGHAPTAERTLNPARMFKRELDPGPGIREQPRPTRDMEFREARCSPLDLTSSPTHEKMLAWRLIALNLLSGRCVARPKKFLIVYLSHCRNQFARRCCATAITLSLHPAK